MGQTKEKEYLPPSSLCHFKIFNGVNTGLFRFVNDSSNEKNPDNRERKFRENKTTIEKIPGNVSWLVSEHRLFSCAAEIF